MTPTPARPALDAMAEELRQIFRYDPETGVITYAHDRRKKRAGDVAGIFHRSDQRRTIWVSLKAGRRSFHSSRVAWAMMTGSLPETVDHKNGDHSDDRWENLRAATPLQQQWNRGLTSRNTSGFVGVSKAGKKGWCAKLFFKGEQFQLGTFKTKVEAHDAYVAASKKLRGEFHPEGRTALARSAP